ncbi:aminotransferase class V [Mycobacterium sp. 852013-51886_SCH5428379]|uniref:aminotransferase class V-fold PLP-dependent enzyme n=1 Tax=Mycobacterium sp. 852013-51886_SCH5428379 TaxID=1834111 RepID=UPI0007FF9CF0|nr:aminotransferase class V-fold PLP-dependent enzyme [Mycobacterium sp. 852013-51886_SCH5428379]OBB60147.1 aminotransferase class V [Mycobacterium sp. 852013-51886_SCH5428379]
MPVRAAFGAEFAGAAGFLNSPTYGLPPQFVMRALQDRMADWQAGTMDATSFDEPVRAARSGYAALVDVSPASVALAGSTSAALGMVAAAIPDGSRGATLAGEFTSTTFPFAAQAARGVSLVELSPDELLATATDYDFVTFSLVQSASGATLDVEALRTGLAGTSTTTIVDVTQAVGWKALNLGWADVTVASVYKWLLAPRGAAFMSVSDRTAAAMIPHAANWYAGERPWESIYGLPLRLAHDARRFDTSPAWFSVLGAGMSLPWLASLDAAEVEAHTVGLAGRLRAELGLPPHPSAIVSLPSTGAAESLPAAGIRASVRAGAVRVGFHLYNTEDDLDRLLDALSR